MVKWEYIKERVQWWSHSKVLEDSGPTPRAFDSKFKVCSFFNFSKLHPHPIIPLHGNHHFFQNAFFFFTSPSNCIRRCPELSYRGRVWFMNCVCKLSHSWEETEPNTQSKGILLDLEIPRHALGNEDLGIMGKPWEADWRYMAFKEYLEFLSRESERNSLSI